MCPWRENTVLSILALAALVLVINVSSKNPLETFALLVALVGVVWKK